METLRELTVEDAAAYRALRLEMLARHPRAFGSSAEAERARPLEAVAERIATQHTLGGFILGAFEGDALVGAAGLACNDRPKERHKAAVWGMYVAAAHRGRGLGRRLLEEALARARRLPHVEQVALSVTVGNDAARALYESLGFEVYGTEPRALKVGGKYLDEVYLWLRLR